MFWKTLLYIWVGQRHWNMEKLKKTLQLAVCSRVWGDKGTGNTVKHDVLERFYGRQMCELLCFEGNHCKNMETHSKNTGFGWFCGKNVDNGAKCCLGNFSGRRRRGYLKFPSWEAPTGGEKWKKLLEGSEAGGNRSSYVCKLLFADLVLMVNTTLSPCHGPK